MVAIARALLVVSVLGAGTSVSLLAPTYERGLVAERPVVDLGELNQGEKRRVVFEVKNRLAEPVMLIRVAKTCSCTAVIAPLGRIEPGARFQVAIDWMTERGRGPKSVKLRLVYGLNDGQTLQTDLLIRAVIIPDVLVAPAVARFSRNTTKCVLRFESSRLNPLVVERPNCSHEAFRAQIVSSSEVVVTFRPDDWPWRDPPPAFLRVQTNSPNEPVCNVALEVVPEADGSAVPPSEE